MTGDRRTTGLTFEEALDARLAQAHWSRREFLGRVAHLGAAAALTQLLVACGQSGSSPTPAPATAGPTPGPTTVRFLVISIWLARTMSPASPGAKSTVPPAQSIWMTYSLKTS